MRLARLRLVGIGPFADTELAFEDEARLLESAPAGPREDAEMLAHVGMATRALAVLFGASGVGKTQALATIATTRPGHALPPAPSIGSAQRAPSEPPRAAYAVGDWALGDDDRARPHALRVVSPNAPSTLPSDASDEAATARRREQTLFDRRAVEGGFCLVAFSGARWFSRTAAVLTTPHRTYARYDARAPASFDDPTRVDLTRETKQALAYPVLGAALASSSGDLSAHGLERGLRDALAPLLGLVGVTFRGVDGATLEPLFDLGGARVTFDELPRAARHLASFAALTLRGLHGAYPTRDARTAEGVVLIDDLDAGLDGATASGLPKAFSASFPAVQLVVTTSSPAVAMACDPRDVIALRRPDLGGPVEVHDAVLH